MPQGAGGSCEWPQRTSINPYSSWPLIPAAGRTPVHSRDPGAVRHPPHTCVTAEPCAQTCMPRRPDPDVPAMRVSRDFAASPTTLTVVRSAQTASSTRAAAAAGPRPPRALQAPSRTLSLASWPPQHAVRPCSNARRLHLHTRATGPAFLLMPAERIQRHLCRKSGVMLSAVQKHVRTRIEPGGTARDSEKGFETTVHTPAA
jgi:hypothetical protein